MPSNANVTGKVGQSYTLNEGQYTRRRLEDISRAVNGGLNFGQPPAQTPAGQTPAPLNVNSNPLSNMSGYWVNMVTPSGPFTVTHNLGRIPTGMLVFAMDQPAIITAVNKAAWTTTTAQFQSSVAGVSLQGFVT